MWFRVEVMEGEKRLVRVRVGQEMAWWLYMHRTYTDRQTDRQIDRKTDRQIDRHTRTTHPPHENWSTWLKYTISPWASPNYRGARLVEQYSLLHPHLYICLYVCVKIQVSSTAPCWSRVEGTTRSLGRLKERQQKRSWRIALNKFSVQIFKPYNLVMEITSPAAYSGGS